MVLTAEKDSFPVYRIGVNQIPQKNALLAIDVILKSLCSEIHKMSTIWQFAYKIGILGDPE